MSYLPKTKVRKNSAGSNFQRSRLNIIEGTNVTLTVADDATDDEVDVTVAAAGVIYGGTGGTKSNTTPSAFTSWGTKTGSARKVLTYDTAIGSPSWDYLSAVEIMTPSEN